MSRTVKKFSLTRRFARNENGVAAIEFAFLAPIFFALVFATLELLLYMLTSMWLENGTQLIQARMEADRRAGNAFNLAQYRTEICEEVPGIGFFARDCESGRLRIAVWYTGRQAAFTTRYSDVPGFPLAQDIYITPGVDTTWGDVWTIGLQLEWPFLLPTTLMLTATPGMEDQGDHTKPFMATVRTAVVPRILVARPEPNSAVRN